MLFVAAPASAADAARKIEIDASSMADALHDLATQLQIQLLYDSEQLARAEPVKLLGSFTAADALKQLLAGTGLQWRFVNERTVVVFRPARVEPRTIQNPQINADTPRARSGDDLTVLPDLMVTASLPRLASTDTQVMGLNMPLLETPRTVSLISSEVIDQNSLSAVEDLMRVAPGVFTTTRFGVQGSIDVRGVPADTYFRGMKRLTLQGHGRSVLAAMDSIEVVAGPASPLYGLGKLGGYTNIVPKSGRARTGSYLSAPEGFVQVIGGEYSRNEISAGFGGPVGGGIGPRRGGFYLYGLHEDSKSYALGVPVKQDLIQAATSIDNILGSMRLETGINYQFSNTSGALVGRMTQSLADTGQYISGSPLVNLDLNSNGAIGYLEMNLASPVRGMLDANNQPLNQVFAWPLDSSGNPLAANRFPQQSGIPKTMYDYLVAHPEADPTGVMRAQGVGGPLPISGQVPVGMVLDPRTVKFTTLDPRHSSAFEQIIKARFLTAYADVIEDTDPNLTYRNQLFFDNMHQYKSSYQPFSQVQDVKVVEDKLTITRQLNFRPVGWRANLLGTVNARNTVSSGRFTTADYGNHRTDAMGDNWSTSVGGMTANTTFASASENSGLSSDGLPWGSIYRTEYSEFGVGAMLDIDMPHELKLVAGARMDGSRATNINYAGRYNMNTGDAVNPGRYIATDDVASRWDSGSSWSISLGQAWRYGLHPYVTASRSTVLLDGNNNSLLNQVINAGHVGYVTLKEAGIKGEWRDGSLSFTAAAFEQGRDSVEETDDANVLTAYVTSTLTRGWQSQLQWRLRDNLMVGFNTLRHLTRYVPNVGGAMQVDARFLGFKDVLDASGNVVYPAEAFLYGGRARIVLPNGMKEYEIKQGNPRNQISASAILTAGSAWEFLVRGAYLSRTCTGRLCLVTLPQSKVFDAGVLWRRRALSVKFDITNVMDEHYFRARTGDTLGDPIAQAMPGRRWQITTRYTF